MYFPEYDRQDEREIIPVDGRGLFVTDSATVEFLGVNQRERFPLVSSVDEDLLPEGSANVIPLEVKGFLLLAPGSRYNFYQAEAYQVFNFSPHTVRVVKFYGTAPVVNNATQTGVVTDNGGQYAHEYSVSWLNDVAGLMPSTIYKVVPQGTPTMALALPGLNLRQLTRQGFVPYNPFNVG